MALVTLIQSEPWVYCLQSAHFISSNSENLEAVDGTDMHPGEGSREHQDVEQVAEHLWEWNASPRRRPAGDTV